MALTKSDFQAIVDQHGPVLYRLAYRLVGDAHDAEEVVQETLRSAWTSRERFDSTRGERAWLAAILRRRAVDRWRRVGRTPAFASSDHVLDATTDDLDPFEKEYTDEMQLALGRLPDEMREALLLVIVGELTHKEAAEVLETPLGTVLSRVSRGREKLRLNLIEIDSAKQPTT